MHGRGDDRAIGDGIRKRDAHFDNARPCAFESRKHRGRDARAGKSGADEGHEGLAAALAELGEDVVDAGGGGHGAIIWLTARITWLGSCRTRGMPRQLQVRSGCSRSRCTRPTSRHALRSRRRQRSAVGTPSTRNGIQSGIPTKLMWELHCACGTPTRCKPTNP